VITTLEELSLNAWPALQTVIYDGWILRFANGYTKRANSVNPIYASTLDVDEKISCCESMYQDKNMPVVFKLTPAVDPSDLDEKLSANGYQKDSPTSVQVMDLESVSAAIAREIKLQKDLSDEWLDNYCRMSAVAESNRETLQQILSSIIPQRCFAILKFEDQVIACGLGVLQSGRIGLFDIVTDNDFRGRGYGQQLVKSILTWGKQNGAQKAYLQVVLDNASALHLYSKIGFTEMYRYWYRIKS
jgi:ribosomal protein S18 acetylase RimI-like enzyme